MSRPFAKPAPRLDRTVVRGTDSLWRATLHLEPGVRSEAVDDDGRHLHAGLVRLLADLERVEVQATAQIEGDILTARILVVEGGQVNGEIKMGEAAERRLASPEPMPERYAAFSEG